MAMPVTLSPQNLPCHETSTYYIRQGQNGTWETNDGSVNSKRQSLRPDREPKEMKFKFCDYYHVAFTDTVMEPCWAGV